MKKSISLGTSFVVMAFCLSLPSQVHATAVMPAAPSEQADAPPAASDSNINTPQDAVSSPSDTPVENVVVEPDTAVPAPADAPLAAAASDEFPPQPVSVSPPEVPVQPLQTEASGAATGGNALGETAAKSTNSGGYYDAGNTQSSRSRGKQPPRRLDPAVTPGGKFVTVETTASAMSYEGQYVAATRALKLGRYAAAMEMFEKLYKKNHKDPRILMGLAVAQQGAGFNQSAAATYEDLLRIDPTNSDAIVNLMGIMKAQYPAVTLQRLMELRARYPANPGIPAQIGLVNAQMDKYDDAIKYLEIAASMDPRSPSHVYNLAIVTDRHGDWAKAIKLYERALELDASFGETANGLNREAIYDRLSVLRRKS